MIAHRPAGYALGVSLSQNELFLLLVAFAAFFTTRWSFRLAPAASELPVKSLLALAAAAFVGLQSVLGYRVTGLLETIALIAAPIWAFGPLLALTLARQRYYGVASALTGLLYWSGEGRRAINRALAQAAVQSADAAAAARLAPADDGLLGIQIAALARDWDAVDRLYVSAPRTGDNSFLADEAAIVALAAQDRLREARDALERARSRWEANPAQQGPVGHRVLVMSDARLQAEHGDVMRVQQLLAPPPPSAPAWTIYAVYARAAERAHRIDEAAALYAHTYAVAPVAARPAFAAKIESYGRALPRIASQGAIPGLLVLLGGLAIAYGLQMWINSVANPVLTLVGLLRPSDAAAAFLLNVPGQAGATLAAIGVPAAEAVWRWLSYALVHGNLVHIGFNLWVLYDLGRLYESRRNWGSLLAAFVFGSVMGAYISSIAQANEVLVLVGASGGVLGVAGALFADAVRSGLSSDRQLTRGLAQWVVIIILFSIAVPGVSLWGHVGGLVGGLLWGFMRQGLPASVTVDRVAGGAAAVLLLYAFYEALMIGLLLASR